MLLSFIKVNKAGKNNLSNPFNSYQYSQGVLLIKPLQLMSIMGKLQSEYEQLWRYIIRPSRSLYGEQLLGKAIFKIKGKEIHRKDFQLTNKRGYSFQCSLWLPLETDNCPCVIYMHGNSSNRLEGMEYLNKLLVNNIAVCTFDFSGSGNSEGQFVSLGFHEQNDLQQVVNYLKNYSKINKIALWGRSMGAVTALFYLSKHKQEITAAIFDSPFKSLKSLVQDMALKTTNIPRIVINGALKIISGTISQKANFNIYDLNPLKYAIPKILIPGLFIVGIDDEIIPVQHTKDLFEAYASDDKVIKMVKGNHNDNRPADCIRVVIKFLLHRFRAADQKKQTLSKKEEEQSVQTNQSQKVEQELVKDSFSWFSLFSIFPKNEEIKLQKKNSKQAQKEQKQIKQTSKQSLAKQQKMKNSKTKSKANGPKQKKQLTQLEYSELQVKKLEDSLKNYNYCFI